MTATVLGDITQYSDFAPFAERAVGIDAASMIRFRCEPGVIGAFVRLPFDVIAGRTVRSEHTQTLDVTVSATAFLNWLDTGGPEPGRQDADWLSPLPPAAGWTRIDVVPDAVIRDLIRRGALLANDIDTRARQEALLSSVVLTVTGGGRTVEVPLAPISAISRMGFLPRDASAGIDVARGWLRIAAPFGSTYQTTGSSLGGGLTLLH
jgi:hypothetical protein